jgi:DNA-binding LacI/PurR family transcriptional regulator
VPDQFGNTILICKQLARQGCRRIGLVIDTHTDLVVDHRFSAAVMWQNTLGGSERVLPLVRDDASRPELRGWFARQRPDAIIAGTESEARVMAQELGLRIPGRVEFALTERRIRRRSAVSTSARSKSARRRSRNCMRASRVARKVRPRCRASQ